MRFSLVTGVQTCALPIFELFPGQKLCDTGSASGNPLQDVSGLELAAPAFVENDLAKNSDLIVFVDRMDIVELTDGLDCLVVEFDFKDAHSAVGRIRSEEHTSELQSLMRISYDVFCLKKNTQAHYTNKHNHTENETQR